MFNIHTSVLWAVAECRVITYNRVPCLSLGSCSRNISRLLLFSLWAYGAIKLSETQDLGRISFGIYLKDLKSSTNSMKLIVLSEIMRFWKPLKQPLPRPCHDLLLQALWATDERREISQPDRRKKRAKSSNMTQLESYPGCGLGAAERMGEDCGRDWLFPAMLEEDEEDEEEPRSPGLLLERENGPGKLSSVWR